MPTKVRGESPVVAAASGDYLVIVITADWEPHHWDAAIAATDINPQDYTFAGEDIAEGIEILLFTKEATA